MNIKSLIYLVAFLFLTYCTGQTTSESKNEQFTETTNSNSAMTKEILKISDLIGKDLQEVETILGKADKIDKVSPSRTPCKENPCDKGVFQSGKYEIVFINNKADWITINQVSSYDLNENAIGLLGLPESNPSFSNPSSVLRWEDIEGIKEVSFFNNGSGKIDYIYVKASTE